jgi:hypothetical protein
MSPLTHPALLAPKRMAADRACWRGLLQAPLACSLLLSATMAQAQMVPHAQHAFHQSATGDVTEARINWRSDLNDSGSELSGGNLNGHSPWPHWEGRIGVLIDRPINPLKDHFVLPQALNTGLRIRSMHLLSDYYISGGFRATAGLVQGEVGQAWWAGGDASDGNSLNLSLQRIDRLNLVTSTSQSDLKPKTTPYLGAGYSTRLTTRNIPSVWRFNADLGLITINSNNIERITQVLQGDRPLEALIRDLRLRPVIKVSVAYSF